MDKMKIFMGITGGTSVLALCFAGYSAHQLKKQKKENESLAKVLKDKLDMTVEEVKNASPIDIQQAVIEKAVDKAAKHEVECWSATEGHGVRQEAITGMKLACAAAIHDLEKDVKPEVAKILKDKASKVSIDEIQQEVIKSTSKEIGKELNNRMDREIEKLMKEQQERIKTLNKVYDNINAAIQKGDK